MTDEKMLKIAWDPVYSYPLPEDHRFPMAKYELIPGQLLHEGTITTENIFHPSPCPAEVVLLTHTREYLDKLMTQQLTPREQRQIGFPQSPALTHRELVITQGTIDCCHFAIKNAVAMNVAGGTHHAFADRGEGFCLLNDFAVAANYLLHERLASRILIIDLDVHQGNGSASIFRSNEAVFTFSMHGKNNYPFKKEKSAFDVELPDGINDEAYLDLLRNSLEEIFGRITPDFVFYLSGVDILASDKFGRLAITMKGCAQRDEMVFTWLKNKGIPCTVAMGGGYSADVKTIVEAHCNTFRLAKKLYELA